MSVRYELAVHTRNMTGTQRHALNRAVRQGGGITFTNIADAHIAAARYSNLPGVEYVSHTRVETKALASWAKGAPLAEVI